MSAHRNPLPQSLQRAGGTTTAEGDGEAVAARGAGENGEEASDADAAESGDGPRLASQPAINTIVTRVASPPVARRRHVIRSAGYPRPPILKP
jgi:hypothetical protein